MLKVLGVVLSVIVITLAGYGLIIKNFEFMSYMFFFLGVFILSIGVRELKAKRSTNAIVSIIGAAFILFVSIYTF
ncbi:Uncharacterised protein [Lysinibacillus sphaericus]|nr:Uncharacterised protein [Lysinibacillus sphaericus]